VKQKQFTTNEEQENTVKLYRPWWSTAIVCVFDQAHSTPKWVGQTKAKTDYKKVLQ